MNDKVNLDDLYNQLEQAEVSNDEDTLANFFDKPVSDPNPTDSTSENQGVVEDPEKEPENSVSSDAPEKDKEGKESTDDPAKGDDRMVPLKEAKEARQQAEQFRLQAEQLQKELEEARSSVKTDPSVMEELEKYKRLSSLLETQIKQNDLQPEKLPEDLEFTEAQLAELKEFGSVGEFSAQLAKQIAWIKSQIVSNQQQVKEQSTEKDPATAAVEADADLSRWNGSKLAWETVLEVDQYLKTHPEFVGKSLPERIPKLKEMVKQRLGEPVEKPAPEAQKQPVDLDKALADSQQKPTSLTDIGGMSKGQEATLGEALQGKSDTEILAHLQKTGKSVEELLEDESLFADM